MTSPDHIGTGWSFPAGRDASGNAELIGGITDIEQSIHLILATAPCERPMRPEFGCGIHSLVFAPLNATTAEIIEQEVRQALDRWEPRAQIDNINVSVDDSNEGLLYIDIWFRARGSNDLRNLVFPFYTIPAHAMEVS
ncbi:GPW/gp25 family protein [Streptomyces murinus]|uniref:GPW/gp25 family protein n=1 Tax=Streptomyces murinus TaxID=33900 RepID=UPI00381774FD